MIFKHILREAEGDKNDTSQSTDYTSAEDAPTIEAEDTDPAEDIEVEDTGTEDESVDYTQNEAEIEPDGPEEEGEDMGDPETTDYTSDEEPAGDDLGAEGEEEPNPEEDTSEQQREIENNRILLDDTVNMYYTIRDTVSRLNEVSKDNVLINKIINQVAYNLSRLERVIYEFIVFQFSKNKYVNNLYKYDYFMKAFQTNIEMLKKIKVFAQN